MYHSELLEPSQTKSVIDGSTPPSATGYARYGKRTIDIIFALYFMLFLSPLLLLTALSIFLTSRGPILLRQPRVGKDGKLFKMIKFRTMRHHRPDNPLAHHANLLASSGVLFKVDRDPRVTGLGALLRRFSIDELPQLLNILKGQMSVIGPRPLLPFMVAPYPQENILRSKVLPGLTGLWQISARGESSSVLQMIDYDVRYQAHISFRNDLRILLRTIPAVVKGTGVK
ncbi:MAG TPA: sugar transferase [Candidatus Kapabacteria bacterium]|jgi:lipopolysaccharide/colanic/teichoic acid biosynthesis glycosyltransferase